MYQNCAARLVRSAWKYSTGVQNASRNSERSPSMTILRGARVARPRTPASRAGGAAGRSKAGAPAKSEAKTRKGSFICKKCSGIDHAVERKSKEREGVGQFRSPPR